MIKLRTVLLSNYLYLIICLISLLYVFIYLQIPKVSKYNENTNSITGIVESYKIDGDKLTVTLENKERVVGNYYFKTKQEKDSFLKKIKLGIKMKCYGDFKIPDDNTIENSFSYKNYLYRQDTFYLISISKYKIISNQESLYFKVKNNIIKHLDNYKTSSYLKTFLLGDKKELKDNVLESYRQLGISHLFAISGMHITLLSGILLKLLKKMKVEEVKRYLIVIIFLISYLFLVGFSPSILRAVLFFILFSINQIYYFYIKPINIFILTLAICLFISPYFIYDVAFLYSFGISFSLILFSDFLNKPKYYFSKLFLTSLISFLISIPISLYNFYQINFMSIIYNLFYVPFVTIIVFPLSIVTTFIPFLDSIFLLITNILEWSATTLQNIKFGILIFPKLNLIYYIGLFIFIIGSLSLNKKILYFILLIILVFHYFYMNILKPEFMVMLDVGQGDSILFYSKGKTMLVDTGGKMNFVSEKWKKKNNYSIVKSKTIPYLKSLGIKKINYLVLTHGDYDHLGEALTLLQNFKVDNIYINEGEKNYLERQINKVHKVKVLKQDDSFNVSSFEVFSLNKNLYNENDSSLVLYIKYFDISLLMMGDASSRSEKEILKTYDLGKIDILKVGHHGSDTSSSKDFIKSINPTYSLISVGKNNKYGHPHNKVLKILDKSKIYRTDLNGSIKVNFKNNGFKIETCLS